MYSSYTKSYDSKLVPIMDYCSSVKAAKCYSKPDTVQNGKYTSNINLPIMYVFFYI